MTIHIGRLIFWGLLEFFLLAISSWLGGEELDGAFRALCWFFFFNVIVFSFKYFHFCVSIAW